MITFAGRGILLDIEGATTSIRFVYDVLFPFARRELQNYLLAHWDSVELVGVRQQIAHDAGHASLEDWEENTGQRGGGMRLVQDEVVRLMDDDVKVTGLKQLQGLIWRSGYESGELRSHVYEDVPPALTAWNEMGRDVRIFSSGSVAAQKLFFAHTIYGNLLSCFRGHYDTTTGPKREPDSYRTIVAQFGIDPADVLFLSDVTAELDAARTAGLRTAVCIRPGNASLDPTQTHAVITDFGQVQLA